MIERFKARRARAKEEGVQDFMKDPAFRVRVGRAVLRIGQNMVAEARSEERFDPGAALGRDRSWAPGDQALYLVACSIVHGVDLGLLVLATEQKPNALPSATLSSLVLLYRALETDRAAVEAWLEKHIAGVPPEGFDRVNPFSSSVA